MQHTTHLAFEYVPPKSPHKPTLVWLCGFRSNMNGTKVQFLKSWANDNCYGFFCFDYSGHGASAGKIEDGTISGWLNESLTLISQHVQGEIILIGSSMGGWIALRLAELLRVSPLPSGEGAPIGAGEGNLHDGPSSGLRPPSPEGRREKIEIQKMVLIAPAPDFTEDLIWNKLTPQQQADFKSSGKLITPSEYSPEPNVFLYSFIEDGRTQLIFNRPYRAGCPVHIVHGTADQDVPLSHGHKLMQHLAADNVQFTHVQGGDHRLSRVEDMEVLLRVIR